MNTIQCKYCHSNAVVKYGKYKAVQYYFCKDCQRKFAGINTIPKMQYPTSQIADALLLNLSCDRIEACLKKCTLALQLDCWQSPWGYYKVCIL